MSTETIANKDEPVKSAGGSRKVRFFLIDPQAEQVSVAGSFNNWNPTTTPLNRESRGRWTRELMLPVGRYEYQFVTDGYWKPDPAAAETVFNPFGGLNSVITVSPDNENSRN
jgi:1,4-alpha-glucan branching enzyme